ncbi:hypothetical protein A2856_04215 [Candidatus Uhrbacteria bacterium RIFCSPHIGHO2_01_FULL_63_20]|uniref:Uncharacterized protein n=1 Tax=Candidatus Uhrbacteria bacterium RIFCSPHIGHO2_01_FULL_63_20 TaxID=1802385 RepID=A0A1F7TMM0_9BACT|nr:MAG: hypothetical protein A2856_04215 [Candidatus Uhrbacteria bacterium RIFCSPHIGHO2_01_FULL_63_20]
MIAYFADRRFGRALGDDGKTYLVSLDRRCDPFWMIDRVQFIQPKRREHPKPQEVIMLRPGVSAAGEPKALAWCRKFDFDRAPVLDPRSA